jgi:hypothetical protein
MFRIEWLASRQETEPIGRMTYGGILGHAAFIYAQSSFAEVKRRHPTVTGFRIVDEAGVEVRCWFVGDNYR